MIRSKRDAIEHKPKPNTNTHVYAGGLSVLGLAIGKIVRQERLDYINNQIIKERKAEKRFTDLNSAMQEYFIVTGRQLEPLPPKPILSDFYVPSEDHHNRELAFITLSMIGIGAFLWYSDK